MEIKQTQDELLQELWADHRDLGGALLLLEAMLKRDKTAGQAETVHCCFNFLHDQIHQYIREIQHISDILVRKAS